jgi:hypothetical protein
MIMSAARRPSPSKPGIAIGSWDVALGPGPDMEANRQAEARSLSRYFEQLVIARMIADGVEIGIDPEPLF